jgi:hypothetical protein
MGLRRLVKALTSHCPFLGGVELRFESVLRHAPGPRLAEQLPESLCRNLRLLISFASISSARTTLSNRFEVRSTAVT